MVVALEGVLGHDAALARNSALLSAVVSAAAFSMRWSVGQS